MAGRRRAFWDPFARYDSGWYYQIARFGYSCTPDGRVSIAFFPLYPLLMRHLGRLFGPSPSDVYVGGIAISWRSFVVAMIGLYHLAKLDLLWLPLSSGQYEGMARCCAVLFVLHLSRRPALAPPRHFVSGGLRHALHGWIGALHEHLSAVLTFLSLRRDPPERAKGAATGNRREISKSHD